MTVAPVCPISQSQPVPSQLPPTLPVVAKPTDLPSLINAINAAAAALRLLALQGPPVNNVWLAAPAIVSGGGTRKGASVYVFQNWSETNRITGDITVYHQNRDRSFDRTQYVDVERIYDITFTPGGSSRNMGMDWIWWPEASEV